MVHAPDSQAWLVLLTFLAVLLGGAVLVQVLVRVSGAGSTVGDVLFVMLPIVAAVAADGSRERWADRS